MAFVSAVLSDEAREKARLELNETDETRREALQELRAQLSEDLKQRPDEWFWPYLRVAKYDVAKAVKRVQVNEKFRADYPELFVDVTLEKVLPVFEAGVLLVPAERDLLGRRLLVFDYTPWEDCSRMPLSLVQDAIYYAVRALSRDQDTQVHGFSVVQDLQGYANKHFYQFTPTLMGRVFRGLQAIPMRLGASSLVHEPFYYRFLFSLCKPLMSEKLKSRIKFIGSDLKKLTELAPAEALLPSLGGTADRRAQIDNFVAFLRESPVCREE